jgi:hypothetical protein
VVNVLSNNGQGCVHWQAFHEQNEKFPEAEKNFPLQDFGIAEH